MAQIGNIIRLSFRDYSHEWRMSGCFILALASVLAPMMILFGLGTITYAKHPEGVIDMVRARNQARREARAARRAAAGAGSADELPSPTAEVEESVR